MNKQSLEAEFGTETAFGIRYVDGQNRVWAAAELDAYQEKLGCILSGLESEFPDGTDAVRCTHYAVQVGKRYPERTLILGFQNEDNPDCEFAQQKLHPGGHDFAVIEDRWLVDPWIKLVRNVGWPIVYDLLDPFDFVLVCQRYGRRDNWKHMQRAEEAYRT